MNRMTVREYLGRKWCPRCHVPLTLVRSITTRDTCTKYVCLCCHASYSELKKMVSEGMIA